MCDVNVYGNSWMTVLHMKTVEGRARSGFWLNRGNCNNNTSSHIYVGSFRKKFADRQVGIDRIGCKRVGLMLHNMSVCRNPYYRHDRMQYMYTAVNARCFYVTARKCLIGTLLQPTNKHVNAYRIRGLLLRIRMTTFILRPAVRHFYSTAGLFGPSSMLGTTALSVLDATAWWRKIHFISYSTVGR